MLNAPVGINGLMCHIYCDIQRNIVAQPVLLLEHAGTIYYLYINVYIYQNNIYILYELKIYSPESNFIG